MSSNKKSVAGVISGWFPNCKEVTLLIVKEQEIHLSLIEKAKLYFHSYVVCKFCKAFRLQSQLLHKQVHNMVQDSATKEKFSLDYETKTALKKSINDALNDQI